MVGKLTHHLGAGGVSAHGCEAPQRLCVRLPGIHVCNCTLAQNRIGAEERGGNHNGKTRWQEAIDGESLSGLPSFKGVSEGWKCLP